MDFSDADEERLFYHFLHLRVAELRDQAHLRRVTPNQGLTLLHFSGQLKRILWDRGAIRGCLEGV